MTCADWKMVYCLLAVHEVLQLLVECVDCDTVVFVYRSGAWVTLDTWDIGGNYGS